MSPAEEGPSILAKLASTIPKLKTPAHVTGWCMLILAIVLVMLAKISLSIIIDVAGFGLILLVFGQVFNQLEKIPEASRAPFLVQILCLLILAFALTIFKGLMVASTIASKTQEAPHYSPAEEKIVQLQSVMSDIRVGYQKLTDRPEMAPAVNKNARQLAERLLAVDDGNLTVGIQVFKYEGVAYAWVMVTGSTPDSRAKRKSIDEILAATAMGEKLVSEVRHPSLYTKNGQDTRDWLINDNVLPRLHRLSAIAYCARWQITGDDVDRQTVQKIFDDLPYDYIQEERPEKTDELRPCLSNKKP